MLLPLILVWTIHLPATSIQFCRLFLTLAAPCTQAVDVSRIYLCDYEPDKHIRPLEPRDKDTSAVPSEKPAMVRPMMWCDPNIVGRARDDLYNWGQLDGACIAIAKAQAALLKLNFCLYHWDHVHPKCVKSMEEDDIDSETDVIYHMDPIPSLVVPMVTDFPASARPCSEMVEACILNKSVPENEASELEEGEIMHCEGDSMAAANTDDLMEDGEVIDVEVDEVAGTTVAVLPGDDVVLSDHSDANVGERLSERPAGSNVAESGKVDGSEWSPSRRSSPAASSAPNDKYCADSTCDSRLPTPAVVPEVEPRSIPTVSRGADFQPDIPVEPTLKRMRVEPLPSIAASAPPTVSPPREICEKATEATPSSSRLGYPSGQLSTRLASSLQLSLRASRLAPQAVLATQSARGGNSESSSEASSTPSETLAAAGRWSGATGPSPARDGDSCAPPLESSTIENPEQIKSRKCATMRFADIYRKPKKEQSENWSSSAMFWTVDELICFHEKPFFNRAVRGCFVRLALDPQKTASLTTTRVLCYIRKAIVAEPAYEIELDSPSVRPAPVKSCIYLQLYRGSRPVTLDNSFAAELRIGSERGFYPISCIAANRPHHDNWKFYVDGLKENGEQLPSRTEIAEVLARVEALRTPGIQIVSTHGELMQSYIVAKILNQRNSTCPRNIETPCSVVKASQAASGANGKTRSCLDQEVSGSEISPGEKDAPGTVELEVGKQRSPIANPLTHGSANEVANKASPAPAVSPSVNCQDPAIPPRVESVGSPAAGDQSLGKPKACASHRQALVKPTVCDRVVSRSGSNDDAVASTGPRTERLPSSAPKTRELGTVSGPTEVGRDVVNPSFDPSSSGPQSAACADGAKALQTDPGPCTQVSNPSMLNPGSIAAKAALGPAAVAESTEIGLSADSKATKPPVCWRPMVNSAVRPDEHGSSGEKDCSSGANKSDNDLVLLSKHPKDAGQSIPFDEIVDQVESDEAIKAIIQDVPCSSSVQGMPGASQAVLSPVPEIIDLTLGDDNDVTLDDEIIDLLGSDDGYDIS